MSIILAIALTLGFVTLLLLTYTLLEILKKAGRH